MHKFVSLGGRKETKRRVNVEGRNVTLIKTATEGCSSRSTPKPRPPSPTMRPNITFQTFACPPAYAAWYCLNGATCFTVKIGESILYNCE
ncbi:Protein spitz [Portunus trituberculatus]|uniref:Protein spitz n=1 Tax=Portunus trituberculatus TaxID=210409 RepID=A0A5B7K6F8_PORTR|nr:Protein spitz [Portunus trituberculatus]